MTNKRELFILEYQKDLNATQAAIRAGYSSKTAYAIGQKLLNIPEVKEALQTAIQSRKSELIATSEQLKEFWTSIMNNEKIDVKNRLRASELLAKAYGDFTVKLQAQLSQQQDSVIVFKWQNE